MKRLFKYLPFYLLVGLWSLMMACQPVHKPHGQTCLNNDWSILSALLVNSNGQQISQSGFNEEGWIQGDIPSTVMSMLRQNGQYTDLYFARNFEGVDVVPFQSPWWYRKEFMLSDKKENKVYRLRFDGLNYKANIWLNGQLIADEKQVEGPFGRWTFDVSNHVKSGENVLAVEIIPPVKGDLTIGFVDWNPAAPDQNMGLWRGVELLESGAASVESPFVTAKVNKETLKQADITIRALITNHRNEPVDAEVKAMIEGIGEVNQKVSLKANEQRDVVFLPKDHDVLKVNNPKLWWPNNLGDAHLYNMVVETKVQDKVSGQTSSRIGIREIEEYKNKEGHKGYKVNGVPVMIKGAGWVDDVLLADSDEKVKAQLDYVKHMNLNCIRLEGFWGRNKTIYEGADERGLLIMVGWSCHWEWVDYCGRPDTDFMAITGPEEIDRHVQSYVDQVRYLRDHPSVFLWVFGSDKLPIPELEAKLNESIRSEDNSRPILASCKGYGYGKDILNVSEVSGSTGVKMLGPYSYVPPVYWYIDTIAGGAYGFNTETGPGPQVPPLESIQRMIPEEDLWPINDMWDFHCGRNSFASLDRYLKAFNARYGEAKDVEEFAFKNQISNYEAMRPMFEAFQVNKPATTGLIQWMLNSAWPEMFWQLYDYYLVPNGAFYGAKKACQPLHVAYNYKDAGIYLVNDYLSGQKELKLQVKILDNSSQLLFEEEVPVSAAPNSSTKVFDLPALNELSELYFIDIKLQNQQGQIVADNFYWLSTKEDVMNFPTTYWVGTEQKEFANLQGINDLPVAQVQETWTSNSRDGMMYYTCELKNTGNHLAFFIETAILDKESNQTLVPVFWNDNYIHLLPGESKVLKATIPQEVLEGKATTKRVRGWNLK